MDTLMTICVARPMRVCLYEIRGAHDTNRCAYEERKINLQPNCSTGRQLPGRYTVTLQETKPADMKTSLHPCSGLCPRCQTTHTLPMGSAKKAALKLIKRLDEVKRLDLHLPPERSDPRLTTDYLFGEARGKMFGVLVCQRADGRVTTLKSFSGQYNGAWEIEGWAPPLFDLRQWHMVNDNTEKEIKKMGAAIAELGPTTPRGRELIHQRRTMSQDLMKALHRLYTLHNFRDEHLPLVEAYGGENGIPNGTADCCGPKLLNYAASNNLRPIGLAEFYYGRQNRQGNRVHGHFYPPCQDKCAPILGYMLCGIVPDASTP